MYCVNSYYTVTKWNPEPYYAYADTTVYAADKRI